MDQCSQDLIMPKLYLAPMLDVTTTHFRKLINIVSPKTILFTEMIVDNTILHITETQLLERLGMPNSNTIVQIGGSNVTTLVAAMKRLKTLGFSHVNLNCGCPSSKVQHGCFGAVLMKNVELVCEIISEIFRETGIVISIKCRIGVDDLDSYEFFRNFIFQISTRTPCKVFFVHSRKCLLAGLNPAQNRKIPALNYDFCYRIKKEFPYLHIVLNGGVSDPSKCLEYLNNLDGLMIGRQAIKDPFIFDAFHGQMEDNDNTITISALERRKDAARNYFASYDQEELIRSKFTIPLNNMFYGHHGNKIFKQFLDRISRCKIKFGDVHEELEHVLRQIRTKVDTQPSIDMLSQGEPVCATMHDNLSPLL